MAGDGSRRQEHGPNQDEHTIVGNSTLLNRRGRAGVSADDSQDCPSLDPPTRLGKRRRPDLSMQYVTELLKRRCSTVLGGLQEATKVAKEWDAILCANLDVNITREEELLAEIDARKQKETLLLEELGDLINKISGQKEREALLVQERKDLFHKNFEQKEREALLIQERKKLLHEVSVRKKTKTLLIQERKKLFHKISGQKERETLLQGYKELTQITNDARRKTKALLLQARKELLSTIDAQKRTETVLLKERTEIINCLSKRIHAQKKEKKLLQERKNAEVMLRKALDKLRSQRATVSDSAINILWDVTQKVVALSVYVEESQLVSKCAYKMRTPKAESRLKMPRTLPSSWEEAKKMINRAQAALTEADRNSRRAQDGIEMMESCCREGLLDRILGRKERASEAKTALRNILDEGQTMEQTPQMEQMTLAAVELKERRSSRRPSSEQMKVPRKRKKPQRYGTSPSPASEEMKVPRERKKPQRYGSSP